MNRERILTAIKIMERVPVGKLRMSAFQTPARALVLVSTEDEMHACGNSACFAGWVAVSPEFRADGGYAEMGEPVIVDGKDPYGISTLSGSLAIAHWLEIPSRTARSLVYGDLNHEYPSPDENLPGHFSHYYGKSWGDITPDDVIAKLRRLCNEPS